MFVAGGNHQMKGVYISLPIKINAQLIKNEKSFNSSIGKQYKVDMSENFDNECNFDCGLSMISIEEQQMYQRWEKRVFLERLMYMFRPFTR
jgi:hypothetical protein